MYKADYKLWFVCTLWSNYLWNWVVVNVNDAIKVLCDNYGDIKQLLKVILSLWRHKLVEGDGGQVADSHLIWGSVLHYFSTQVAALDGTKVLYIQANKHTMMYIYSAIPTHKQYKH